MLLHAVVCLYLYESFFCSVESLENHLCFVAYRARIYDINIQRSGLLPYELDMKTNTINDGFSPS